MRSILRDNILKICALLAACGFLFALPGAYAQTESPALMMTWRAQSYVPEYFSGKALPAPGARVVVALEAIENGARVNLSGSTIYWYVDEVLVSNTIGTQSISFIASDTPGVVREVRAEIQNYRGRGTTVLKTIRIPTVAPRAVIEAPFAGGTVSSPSFTLRARPFYFNIADPARLSYAWNVDGKTPTALDNPAVLAVTLVNSSPGRVMRAILNIQNPGSGEEASRAFTLTFNP